MTIGLEMAKCTGQNKLISINPLKRSGVRWLDFKMFSAIQV